MACRRKVRRTRKWATSQKIEFSLEPADIRSFMIEGWPDTTWRLARVDRAGGFVPGNVYAQRSSGNKTAPARMEPMAAGRLLHAALPPGEAQMVSAEAIAKAYERQEGMCHYSGWPLAITGRRRAPGSAHVYMLEVSEGDLVTIRLVTRAVFVAMGEWGPKHLVRLAKDITGHAANKKSKKERR